MSFLKPIMPSRSIKAKQLQQKQEAPAEADTEDRRIRCGLMAHYRLLDAVFGLLLGSILIPS
jgi:hypothetical protein